MFDFLSLTFALFLAGFLAIIVALHFLTSSRNPPPFKLAGTHVVITGGSSGIGKEVAREVLKKGANVTILARNQKKLDEAKYELDKEHGSTDTMRVITASVDVSKDEDGVKAAILEAEKAFGPVDMLINSAGTSTMGVMEDMTAQDFQKLLDVNVIGSVIPTKCVMSSMKERKKGRIVFLSSQAGQVGVFSFSAYSASKFALRGIAESLQMELKPYNVFVTVSFPPDTDTPGYAEEMKDKTIEAVKISETSGLFQADLVAKTLVNDAVKGKFNSYIGVDGFFLLALSSGLAPTHSVIDALGQILAGSILRIVALFYCHYFDWIVRKCKEEKEKNIKKTS